MKLSFSTLPCEGWSVEQLIAFCKKCGFEGIELKENMAQAVSLNSSKEEFRQVADKFREVGIAVTNIGSRVTLNGAHGNEAEQFNC